MAEKKKIKNIVSWIVFVVLMGLVLWSPSRIFIQQQLMKIGFFKPKLEKPVELEGAEKVSVQDSIDDKASFLNANNVVYDTEQLKGKVLFINFWATWCPPCRAEMPSIQKLYDKFKDNDNIEFLIVEIEGDTEGTEKFLTDQKLKLPIVYPNGEIPSNWLGGAIPTTVILDKSGKIAAKEEGMYDYSTKEVEAFVQNLIDQ
ncbi:TlpA family protein disulfide reductase [Sphingobacterium yanglingense]|uniref:Thiol-disulfide isomerase/thioredoxin n=1 Tax=Sphingobacterium yanglingense TaxID=1437280 RepID=A0A4R6WCV7_9SPHI|nr:TlpA family protein disulfide reductase [Sphingobacterium yanglingense]TDQ77438.1 thiol-disulfide isomerase/thioredoxin [Sphingobacterium yanglingense]